MLLVALDAFAPLVAAIVCAAAGLTLWDLTSRRPSAIVASLANGLRGGPNLAFGALRFFGGLGLLAAAVLLVARALPFPSPHLFSVASIAAFLGGLLVEAMLGDDLRARFRKVESER